MVMTKSIWDVCSRNVVSEACQCYLEEVRGYLAAPQAGQRLLRPFPPSSTELQ